MNAMICLCVALLPAAPAAAQKLASTYFPTGAEGWSAAPYVHEGPYPVSVLKTDPEYLRSGCHSGGCIRAGELERETNYWVAPAAFLGNKGAAYGGWLRFALRIEHDGGDYFDGGDIVLIGRGMALIHDLPENPSQSWQVFSAPLTAGGWKKNALDGPQASEEEMRAVLSSLAGVLIRGEYIDGNDASSLDSVELLGPGDPQPAVQTGWGSGPAPDVTRSARRTGRQGTRLPSSGGAQAEIVQPEPAPEPGPGRTIRIPGWMPRYPGADYRGTAQGETGNIHLTTTDPSVQVADYYLAALRRAGCRPSAPLAEAGSRVVIRGIVPTTGKTLVAIIAPLRDGQTRVGIQYGLY